MNYYIFVKNCGGSWEDKDIKLFKEQLRSGWDLANRTPNRSKLKAGDKVLFYISGPHAMVFVADATIQSAPKELSQTQKKKYCRFPLVFNPEYWVTFNEYAFWGKNLPIKKILHGLNFVTEKRNFGASLQGGVKEISEKDYLFILAQMDRL